jgi:hypothetical protein
LLGKHNFFIIREHGFLSTGANMEQAGALSLHYKQKNESLM